MYPEEQWCELHPKGGRAVGVCYLHKLSGSMKLGGRPDDFRPYLKVYSQLVTIIIMINACTCNMYETELDKPFLINDTVRTVFLFIYVCMCMYVCMCNNICMCMCVCVYVFMCMCMHNYVCVYV